MSGFSRCIKPVFALLAVCFCLAVAVSIFFRARSAHYDYDGSFNLQVSTALANEFVYRSNYHPFSIYDPAITTNGPMQYAMALALQVFDLDLAKAVVLIAIYCGFIGAAFWVSPLSAVVAAFLSLTWPALGTSLAVFHGDVAASALCLVGTKLCQRWSQETKKNFPVWAAVIFGLAISTKFICVVFVPVLIVYGLADKWAIDLPKAARAGAYTYLVALGVFVAVYYFSVVHSFLALYLRGQSAQLQEVRWTGLIDFVVSHFKQEAGTARLPFTIKNFTFLDTYIFVFSICAIAVGIYENVFYGLFAGQIVIALAATALLERRLLPFLCLVPLLGSGGFWRLLGRVRTPASYLFCGIFLIGLTLLVYGKSGDAWITERRALNNARMHGLEYKGLKQLGRLPDFLRYAEYPIVTSAWWQLPEASLLTGRIFFDRMDVSTANAVRGFDKFYLLFRTSQSKFWPYTTRELCGKILFDENDFVFCEFNKAQPLDKVGVKGPE